MGSVLNLQYQGCCLNYPIGSMKAFCETLVQGNEFKSVGNAQVVACHDPKYRQDTGYLRVRILRVY